MYTADIAAQTSRRFKIMKARLTLSSDIRSALTAANPDWTIFAAMDEADRQVDALLDREVVDILLQQGLAWSGQYWMKPEFINAAS